MQPRPQIPAAYWTPLAELSKWARNPRRNEKAVPQVARSIRKYGFVAPVVVWKSKGQIVAGHTRVAALESLLAAEAGFVPRDAPGAGLVPVRFHEFADESEAAAYAIADNRLSEISEWDDEKLGEVFAELRRIDESLLLETGFGAKEIDRLIRDVSGGAGEDAGPTEPPVNPVSKLGELYQLGPHRLLCGDSTNTTDVAKLLNGERAVLMATDAPYLVDYDGEDRRGSKKKNVEPGWDTFIDAKTAVDFFYNFIRVALDVALVEKPWVYQWYASRRHTLVEAAWQRAGLFVHQQLIWVKPRPVLSRSHFMWRHEPCLYGWVEGKQPDKDRRPSVSGDNSTVWEIDGDTSGLDHPTVKPLPIFERPLGYHTLPGELVFEPFAGSGTQLIAAARLGRRCCAMELSPAFCDVIRIRWTKYARSAGVDAGTGALEETK
ncbi:MAG: DNA methyltransferase [Myxococcaceae bacterium]